MLLLIIYYSTNFQNTLRAFASAIQKKNALNPNVDIHLDHYILISFAPSLIPAEKMSICASILKIRMILMRSKSYSE